MNAATTETYKFYSKIVFPNASTLNSAGVVMNSATDVWQDELSSSRSKPGHDIMNHHYNVSASGLVEGYDVKSTFGQPANGFTLPD